ncbi:MAG: peptidylprolyl isomerase [Syntrophobacteraceae bacterium]
MYSGKKWLLASACIVLQTLLYAGPVRCEFIDRTVAVVNGEIILYSDIQAQILLLKKVMPDLKIDDPEQKAKIERDVLTQLIRQRLTEQEVKRLKITVPNAEVDASVENVKKQNQVTQEQFEYVLKQNGQTLEKFREGIKKELERGRLLERVLKAKTVITDQQIEAALRGETGDKAVSKNKVRLGIILLPADEKKGGYQAAEKTGREILDKLKGGADFRKLAREHSKGPAAQEGGDIGFISTDDLAPAVSAAVSGLQKDQVSNLVRAEGGYYILKVFDIDQEKQNKSDPMVREKVRRELFQKEVDRKFDEWVRDLEAKSFIQISL